MDTEDTRDSFFFDLFFQNRQSGGGVGERLLQCGVSLFGLAQTRHDADIDARPRMVFSAGEQVGSGLVYALFSKSARLVEHAPVLQLARHFEIVAGVFRTTLDQRRLQRSEHFLRLALTSANGGDLLHPLRIFVGKFIDAFVVGGSFVEAHQAFFEPGALHIEIGAVGSDRDRLRIGIDGGRIVLQIRLCASQHHRPAIIAWRLGNGLGVEVDQLLLALVTQRVERGLGDQRVVFRKVIDEFDVLIDRTRIVIQSRQRGDEATAQSDDLRLTRVGGKRRIAKEHDLVEIELLQTLVVARLRVGVGQGGEVRAIVGRIFQQSGQQVARRLELFRVGFLARGFIAELRAEGGIGILRGLQQHRDGLRLHLHAPVEIDCRAHDSESLRIVVVERLDILLGRGEILAALVKADQLIAKLQAGDRIGGQRGLLFERVLANGLERLLLRQDFDIFSLLDRSSAIGDRVEERGHLLFAILRLKNLHLQIYRGHGRIRERPQLRRALVNQVAEFRPARQFEQTKFRRRFGSAAERTLHVLVDGVRIVALVFVDGSSLVGIEVWVAEAITALAKQTHCVVEIEIVPIDGGGFEVASGLTRSDLWDTLPIGRGLRELFAVGIDVADPRHDFGVGGVGLQQVVFDLSGNRSVGWLEVGERAEDRRCCVTDLRLRRILGGERLQHGRAFFEMRAPQVCMRKKIGCGGILLPSGRIGRALANGAEFGFELAGAG